ncbi:MAG: site-2 protease family protein [Candidatus Rokuibacteriota bacterium]
MTGGVVTLFRVAGIPVRIHVSWLVIFGLIAWSLSVGYFPQVLPGLTVRMHWVTGFVAALLLFVSVFLHELSHSVVARGHGLRVSGITLHVFGGVSQLEEEPGSPGVEFKMAIVGPLTSFVIAAVAALAARAAAGEHVVAAAVLGYLALVNTLVGAFNLVPGFPLDGGRVLRAALWRLRGDLQWATRVAASAGGTVAFLLMALGVFRGLAGDFLGGLWFVLIGLFLRQASQASYQQLLLRRTLEPLAVRDVMTAHVVHVAPDLTVARAVDDVFWRHHVSSFPVVAGGQVLGIVGVQALGQVPRERWADTKVGDIMLPISDQLTTSPGQTLWDAFQKLSSNGLGRLAVLESGRLVGYLSVKDVMHVLAVSTGRAPRPPVRSGP